MIVFLTAAGTARAGDSATKFSRGLLNTAFGWFEIMNEIGNEADREGPAIGIPAGFLRGTFFAAGRTLAGVYEMITFPFPNGKKGYEPILLPESVFQRR